MQQESHHLEKFSRALNGGEGVENIHESNIEQKAVPCAGTRGISLLTCVPNGNDQI